MKKRLYLFSLLIICMSCNQQIKNKSNFQENNISSDKSDEKQMVTSEENYDNEIFDWPKARLNSIPLQTNIIDFKHQFSNFDSTVVDYDNCNGVFQDDYIIAYLNKSRFQINSDSIIAESIYLVNNLKLTYNSIELSNLTTLEDFNNFFPKGSKNKLIVNNSDFGLGDNITLIKIKESGDDIDYVIHFFFKESMLFFVARWYPC